MRDLEAATNYQEVLEEAITQLKDGHDLLPDQIVNIEQAALESGYYPTLKNFRDMIEDPDVDPETIINKLETAHRGAQIF